MSTPAQAINKLKTKPKETLKYYQFSIAGDPNPSSVCQYSVTTIDDLEVKKGKIVPKYVNYRPGSILGSLNTHATPRFQMAPTGSGAVTGAATFQAHSIQMVSEGATAIPAIAGYLLPSPSAHILAVTGMLTGCSFVALDTGNGILTTHIQPNSGNAAGLRTNLINNGHFAGHPGTAVIVYGSHGGAGGVGYDHRSERVTVIGSFIGGSWAIYAQAFANDGKVLRVDQIL